MTRREELIEMFKTEFLGEDVISHVPNRVYGFSLEEIADIIVSREEAMLDAIQSSVEKVRNEIVDEISKRPQYANAGKKGCVTRINNEIIPTIQEYRGDK